jgi:hypothetical protein
MKIMPNIEFLELESVCLYRVAKLDEKLVTDWKKVKECDHGILSKHYSGCKNCREIKYDFRTTELRD